LTVSSFIETLLRALADLEDVEQVALRTEGPVVNGRASFREGVFLAFYYNQATGTQAFALVKDAERVWGIDYDNVRGWHLHPVDAPSRHVAIEPQSVSAIVRQLGHALAKL
jgi:hypothetical protein